MLDEVEHWASLTTESLSADAKDEPSESGPEGRTYCNSVAEFTRSARTLSLCGLVPVRLLQGRSTPSVRSS